MVGHKESLGIFKKTEIISSIFSNHNAMKLEINYKEKKLQNVTTNICARSHTHTHIIGIFIQVCFQ